MFPRRETRRLFCLVVLLGVVFLAFDSPSAVIASADGPIPGSSEPTADGSGSLAATNRCPRACRYAAAAAAIGEPACSA